MSKSNVYQMIQKVLGKNKMDVILVIKLGKRPLMTSDFRERVQQENTAKIRLRMTVWFFKNFEQLRQLPFWRRKSFKGGNNYRISLNSFHP